MTTITIGCCTLIHAAWEDAVGGLGEFSALVADPPYGNDYRQKRSRDKLVRVEVEHAPIIGNATPFDPRPLLALAPVQVLWGGNYYADKLPPSSKWLIWDKRENTTPDDGADTELAWTNLPGVSRIHRQLWRGICRRGEENISKGARKLHPNQKPVALMNFCLDQIGAKAHRRVLDTHTGSATTGVACLRRGIPFVGIEKDPVHFATAVDRLLKEHAALQVAA
jgi:site-specific DNA-methyltransferase (adenine-specific)